MSYEQDYLIRDRRLFYTLFLFIPKNVKVHSITEFWKTVITFSYEIF